nr:MAG TPA_asm: hypothetical protein [Caudoviricetes sp.]DAZ82823.1 MAG TPA: hypothetical protein [Caudoviricetes sp.]
MAKRFLRRKPKCLALYMRCLMIKFQLFVR